MKRIKEAIIYWSANFFVGTLSLIGKVYPVRIGHLVHNRGHLLVNTEYWLKTHQSPSRGLNLFLSARDPWNRQALRMIKRKLLVLDNDFVYRLFQAFYKRRPESNIWIDLTDPGQFHPDEWNSVPPQIVLNDQEQNRGKLLLKEMGIAENEPIVCFFCRDDKYLDEAMSHGKWDYHNYRNSDIENYLKAIEWLTDKGYRALRMGALVERPLTTGNPRIIDYASTCRSDFMDIFLFSYCRFVVGDTAGTLTIPLTFNTPYIETNLIPIGGLPRSKNALWIPKKLSDKRTGRTLTFREIYQKGLDSSYSAGDYDKAGVEVIENSPEEIADVTTEMYLRLEGKWESTSEDERLQELFRAAIPEGHITKGFVSRIGTAFLRNNQDMLA